MDITNNDRWEALHDFAKDGSYTLFTYFTSLRRGINIKTNEGKNCLYICGLYGHMPLCKTAKDSDNFNMILLIITPGVQWISLQETVVTN